MRCGGLAGLAVGADFAAGGQVVVVVNTAEGGVDRTVGSVSGAAVAAVSAGAAAATKGAVGRPRWVGGVTAPGVMSAARC
jgi:hypothetical protein